MSGVFAKKNINQIFRDLFGAQIQKRTFSVDMSSCICLQDNEVGHGSGFYNNQQFFQGKPGHSSFVPLCGLLKAEDFENGPSGSGSSENSIKRRNKKMVDELDLKRRSNSQQQHLADYKMKQNLNRLKNSSNGSHEGGSSRAGTDDNFSPSILGSLEQDIVNWTPSTQSSPPRQNRFPISPERKNDLSLIGTPQELNPSQPARDPYASEDLIVAAEGKIIITFLHFKQLVIGNRCTYAELPFFKAHVLHCHAGEKSERKRDPDGIVQCEVLF